jgi:hypothetical protein
MNISRSISTLGKFYLSSSFVISLLIFAKSLDPYSISYTFNQTIFELALWRPFTAVLYLSRIGLLLPFHLIFAYIAFIKAEEKVFPNGDRAALLWVFILSVILLSIFSTFSSLYFFGNSFIMILLMMWAVQYPTDTMKISKINLQSIYFPLIYAATMVLLGSSFKNYMAGFLMGVFLGVFKNPTFVSQHGDRLPVPAFIKNYYSQ